MTDVDLAIEEERSIRPVLLESFEQEVTSGIKPSGRIQICLRRKETLAKVMAVLDSHNFRSGYELRVMDFANAEPKIAKAYDSGMLDGPILKWWATLRKDPNFVGLNFNSLRVNVVVRSLQEFVMEPNNGRVPDTLILTLSNKEKVALPVIVEER